MSGRAAARLASRSHEAESESRRDSGARDLHGRAATCPLPPDEAGAADGVAGQAMRHAVGNVCELPPIAPAPGAAQDPQHWSMVPPGMPTRLLLLDPDAVSAEAVTTALQELTNGALSTVHVRGLREGLQWLSAEAFDVLLTDLSLPDARGFDSVIRLHAAAPETPIIVTTSLDDEAFALQALELGAQDYLVKGSFNEHSLGRSLMYACQRKRLERRLLRMAHFDDVTGMRNRPIFRDRLGHLLHRARREGKTFSLMLIGVEEYHRVHEQHGREISDELLRLLARRLQTCLRESDTLARIGGDQFAALLENTSDAAETVASRIWQALGTPITVGTLPVQIRPHIVTAHYPSDGETAESLLRAASRRLNSVSSRTRRTGLSGAYESQLTLRPR